MYLIALSCLWTAVTKEGHTVEVKDAWRKVEEEDQVICDCYSILSNQLMLLLSSLCLTAMLILELLAVEQQLAFYKHLPAFDTSLTLFLIISSCYLLPHHSLVYEKYMIPVCWQKPKGSWKQQCPALLKDIKSLWSLDVTPMWSKNVWNVNVSVCRGIMWLCSCFYLCKYQEYNCNSRIWIYLNHNLCIKTKSSLDRCQTNSTFIYRGAWCILEEQGIMFW